MNLGFRRWCSFAIRQKICYYYYFFGSLYSTESGGLVEGQSRKNCRHSKLFISTLIRRSRRTGLLQPEMPPPSSPLLTGPFSPPPSTPLGSSRRSPCPSDTSQAPSADRSASPRYTRAPYSSGDSGRTSAPTRCRWRSCTGADTRTRTPPTTPSGAGRSGVEGRRALPA